MNQNKQSGFVKWLLITISVLFLFVMLVLPLLVVITQAFKSQDGSLIAFGNALAGVGHFDLHIHFPLNH